MKTTSKIVLEPWFTVSDGERAVAFYKAALGAVETYRLSEPEAGVVVKPSINGAEFWIRRTFPGLPCGELHHEVTVDTVIRPRRMTSQETIRSVACKTEILRFVGSFFLTYVLIS